ncbi:MAG TPA: outer membrane beta-barrel protein, partial [Ignavibacteriaceae bacterium]|nr:outer membrane beta-barrel protein [Ignavibacteriaceae bacterium]
YKMKKLLLTIVALTFLTVLNQSIAQDKWSLEFRPGVNYATQDIADADLGLGFGTELTIAYRFMLHLAAYAGWSYNNFAADQSFAGTDASFEETGYTFGFQFIHPIGESGLSYLVRAGGTYNHIEIENNGGDIIIDSGHGLGWQAEAGLVIPLSEKFSLLPSLRYRSLNRDIEIENVSTSVDLNYLSVGVGLSWSF